MTLIRDLTFDDLAPFLSIPARVYAKALSPLLPDEDTVRRGATRQIFQRRQRILLAFDGTDPVARVVARLSPSLRDAQGKPVGMLGFFEAVERPETVGHLLREAVAWLRGCGAGEVVGPMDGDTWHRYRFNLGPFDEPAFPLEPLNPPYYPALWEGLGFEVYQSYYSKRVDDAGAALPVLEQKLRAAADLGYAFRPLDLARFDADLRLLYDLSSRIFTENRLYTEIPWEDFRVLYEGVRPLLEERLVWFAISPKGEPVGFQFSFAGPDGTIQAKTVGVLPQHRRHGVAAALAAGLYRHAVDTGRPRINLCLIHDANASGTLDAGKGRVFRRYRLYRWRGDVS